MRKVLYKASNRYSCQGVTLMPGNNDVDDSKFKDFIVHPGVVSRINLGIIEVIGSDKSSDDNSKDEETVESICNEVEINEEEAIRHIDSVYVDRPVKEVVEKVKSLGCVSTLMTIIQRNDSVRVTKACEQRIDEIVKSKNGS